MKLEGYSGPMCNKHVHSTVTRSSRTVGSTANRIAMHVRATPRRTSLYSASMCDTATMKARIRQKRASGESREQTGSRNMAATVFLTQRPRLPILPKVGQSTQLLPLLQIHFLHAFFELRSISRHFGPFWALLP